MYKQITIQTLHKQGVASTRIARELGCHRNTVANVLQRETVIEKQSRVKPSGFEPYSVQIKEWLDKRTSRRRMYDVLHETYGVQERYDTLCKYIQKHFPKPVEAFGVQVTVPGEVGEIDFGYLGMFPGPLGTIVKTYGFAAILTYSRVGYFAICHDQKLETLIRELTHAFEYFGGVPKRLKVDNMRTAILQNQHYDLVFNQDFLEYANHYATVIIPCTPYHPEQKGMVESGIKYLQGNFISERTFVDMADMKGQLCNWTTNYANARTHGTTRRVPMEVLQTEEREKLQPLPAEAFSFFNRGVRTVGMNSHIHFENTYYSVPCHLVGKEVTIRWNEHLVRVIYEGEQVALHQKSQETGIYVTQRSHLPDYKVYSHTEYQKRFEEQFTAIGADAHAYFCHLLKQHEPYWFRIARSILGLREQYGSETVNAGLKRALYYGVGDVATIKNILEKKLYREETEPKLLDGVKTDSLFTRELSYYATGV